MEIWLAIAAALWLIAPAFASNSFPPLMRGCRPIDRGKKYNGKRILGDGKTIEGFIGGVAFGVVVGLILMYFQPAIFSLAAQELTTATPTSLGTFNSVFPSLTFVMIFLLSLGAMLGDILGSFIKRRSGLKRGQAAPGMDQLGFVIVGMLLISPFYTFTWEVIIVILVLTPIFHLFGNVIGYLLRLKREPY